MNSGSGTKNPPWARSSVNSNMTGMNPQIMDPMMSQQGMMPFQQSQPVFNANMMQAQGGMSMPMGGQMPMNQMAQGQMYPGNVVAYPTPRSLNPGLYPNAQNNQAPPNSEQRVFTGTVTKTHNDFGFVDHDVFYQTSVCAKGVIPKVHDRVLVEATYNPNMPFKWNATRVQVLPKNSPNQNKNSSKSSQYNAVPPPINSKKSMPPRRDDRREPLPRREERIERKRSRTRSRSRSRDRRDSRNRRDSPPRKRPVVRERDPTPVKYVVRVPRMPLDIQKLDVPGLSQRYTNLYVPSDFFNAQVKWGETFPPQMPFSLNSPCGYHIMSKEVESPRANDSVLEPPDSDYRFSAKVMLISMPTLESLYQKCGLTKLDEKDKRSSKTPLHPTRLIKFLVGQKGKGGENFAIGGPWSPSLDGENPESDPSVLVRTAIRTCKALTGVDLSACSQWYRMVEFYYWRERDGGKSRLETVVLFLPDVWSAQPSRVEWTTVLDQYKAACEAALQRLEQPPAPAPAPVPAAPPAPAAPAEADTSMDKSQIEDGNDSTITIDETEDDEEGKPEPTHYSKLDVKTMKVEQLRRELQARKVNSRGVKSTLVSRLSKLLKAEEAKETNKDEEEIMEVDDEDTDKPEMEADVKQSSEAEKPKEEKSEDKPKEEKDDKKAEKKEDKKEEKKVDKKEEKKSEKKEEKKEKTEKEIEEEKRKLEKDKQQLKSRFEMPSDPHIIVHPNPHAKGGKFSCSVATLSLLLDYRVTDNKEHSFELFVFAELFNEMLQRDFGFYIYKTLYTLPEKAEEVKEKEKDKDKSEEKKKEEGDKKEGSDSKKESSDVKKESSDGKKEGSEGKKEDKESKDKDRKDEKEKRDDRRDDRREASRRRRDSHSDDERSGSPKRRSRGVDLPPDPYLLLSLVYFDTSRCGYISRKDLQNLFMSLGLQLSRSQIKSILDKVCIREQFSYKSLAQTIKDLAAGSAESIQDLPLDGTVVATTEVPPHIAELEAAIAAGNRELLPVFNRAKGDKDTSGETKDVSDTGVVMYKNRLVDVGALLAAEARGATQRSRLEEALQHTRKALEAARKAAASTLQAERGAQHQLSDLSSNLAHAKARIASLTASSKIFHSTLKSIQAKVEAVVNIKYEDDDVVEVVSNGPKSEKEDVKPKKEASSDSTKKEKEVKEESPAANKEKPTEQKESDSTPAEMDLEDKE